MEYLTKWADFQPHCPSPFLLLGHQCYNRAKQSANSAINSCTVPRCSSVMSDPSLISLIIHATCSGCVASNSKGEIAKHISIKFFMDLCNNTISLITCSSCSSSMRSDQILKIFNNQI